MERRATGRNGGRNALLGLVCALSVVAGSAAAQTADRSLTEAKLEELKKAAQVSEERARELQSEASAIRADRGELNRRLIETADRIKASERQIDAAEQRITRLGDQERILRASLKARRGELTEILAALQRLGRKPPPALMVRPEAALEAIRSAILLGAVLPELRVEAQKLAADLQNLIDLREQITTERTRLIANTEALAEERVRIAALIESKQTSLAETLARFEEARQRSEKLGRETTSLQELIARMDAEIGAPETEDLDPQARRAALTDPGRIRPALAFADAHGLLPLPVAGEPVLKFGEADGFGSASRGVSIATRARAQVTSPSDGWVVYSGPFRSYGQLLIINAGDGYHIVLAGLERISVDLGQFVLAGEPVGSMGSGAGQGPAVVAAAPSDKPVLYVEFRKDGDSIDPAPWWVSTEEKVRG